VSETFAQNYKSMMPGLSDSTRNSVMSNQYAQALALGDPRGHMKQLDRPGVSRGAGTKHQAGISASADMVEGLQQAYQQDLQSRSQQGADQLEAQGADADYAQQQSGFAANDYYSDVMNRLSQQQMMMNFASGLLGDLLS
jgi:hypothetical protein